MADGVCPPQSARRQVNAAVMDLQIRLGVSDVDMVRYLLDWVQGTLALSPSAMVRTEWPDNAPWRTRSGQKLRSQGEQPPGTSV